MLNLIKSIVDKGVNNPSGIVSCLYSKGITGKFQEIRKMVIKDLDRLSKSK